VYVACKPLLDQAAVTLSEDEMKAMDLYHQEKWHHSVRAFEKIRKEDMSVLSLNSYGIALHKIDRADDAAAVFRLASEKDSDSFRSLVNLAQMLEKPSPTESLRIYKQIIQLHKVCVRSWQKEKDSVNSKFCDKLKLKEGEYSNFKKVVMESVARSANIYDEMGEEHLEEHLSVLKYGLKVDENSIRMHFLLGRLYLVMQDIVSATTYFEYCTKIKLDSSNPDPEIAKYKGVCAGLLRKIEAINERKVREKYPDAVRAKTHDASEVSGDKTSKKDITRPSPPSSSSSSGEL